MKLTRKLIPAFAMLLVSAVLMSTASFAWFSMNDKVSAEGMEVTAKATDDIFLEISADGANFDRNADAEFAKELLPVAHETLALGTIETASNWFYKIGTNAESSAAEDSTKTLLSTMNVTDIAASDYVAKVTFTLRANPNTVTEITNVHVKDITITPSNGKGGVTVIIAGDKGFVEFSETSTENDTVLFDSITTEENKTLSVYIFLNGEHADVKTNNKTLLGGTVSFTLVAEPASNNG